MVPAILVSALGAGIASPASAAAPEPSGEQPAAAPLLEGVDGIATFCLTPEAAHALDAAGITMSAQAPVRLTTDPGTGQPCFTEAGLTASVTPDLTNGEFTMPGSVTFTRPADGQTLTFTTPNVKFGLPSTVSGSVTTSTVTAPVAFAQFTPDPLNIQFNPLSGAISASAPIFLTTAGADAFTKAFGSSPWTPGSQIFTGSGSGTLQIPVVRDLAEAVAELLTQAV